MLEVKNLYASVRDEDIKILKGVNLEIGQDELHAIMGPNGSGKSTLANVIMGNPRYKIDEGDIIFEGESIKDLTSDERAKKGIFMTFQNPYEIEGVKFNNFLLTSYRKIHGDDDSYKILNERIQSILEELVVSDNFLNRFLNVGFSGGEKKKGEILQARFLSPKLLILDEIDSGLDVDALRIVAAQINKIRKSGTSILIITHYKRILNYLDVDKVHVYTDGRIVRSGDFSLADEVEQKGYSTIVR
ncbi:ABC transporter ATP-binding protein [Thermosipho melanesiensis]|uniref:ABC transporter ATP-binding protein n=1 Tax=Thermosipho melanesiensis TaxID=46541 RepID=A0ABM6GC76_9BACT|nr:Fe-S cluster assembly ATPase SufC [Thermosipho melanesiensis]APT73138.1 ABC transporter ATP-binding protein [Thermosipho melanesiensis]OOC38731.1 ABC transporter ATP-binding protein [Thermosipho melanesiensis]OOC40536.1 ABC transporter ATP-binding protein [Thermosipho melanesiensis]OOC40800.1 ABC transporter ATP-binding protein [Thermosipho melanesiensis]OOC44646.1 ABC transporter ATP-binding protein [Thermosipho melanesiensis]